MGKNILNFIKSRKTLNYFKYYDDIKNSEFFDEDFYIEKYGSYIGNQDPLTHYLLFGYKLSFYPSLNFDGDFYLNCYPNIKKQDFNPLFHFIAYGQDEGKIIQKPYFITRKNEIIKTNELLLNNYEFEKYPLVSIIILNFNGLNHLKRLFKEFDDKINYPNYEIIIVDNNSFDDSITYLKTLNLPITIIEHEYNESFSKSNNDAVKIANGDYLLFLNNDVEPTKGWLNEMMGVMLNNNNVGAVGSKLIFPFYQDNSDKSFTLQHSGIIFKERMYNCCSYPINNSNNNIDIFDSSLNINRKVIAVTGAVMLVKKEIYQKLGGFDENYDYGLEDIDFCLNLYKNSYDTYYCGTSLLFHHESSTRVKSKEYIARDKKNYDLFLSKWREYLSKNLLIDKIHNNKFFTKKDLKITIINNNLFYDSIVELLAKNYVKKGYEINIISDFNDKYIGNSTDILINFSSEYCFSDIICRDDLVEIKIENNTINIIDFKNQNNIITVPIKYSMQSNEFAFEIINLVEKKLNLK